MLKEKLKIIIREFQQLPFPEMIQRRYTIDFDILNSRINKVVTVIGPRRAGKTYFLLQIMEKLMKIAAAVREDFIYVNFEDERIMPLKSEDLQLILDAYGELYANQKRPFIFFDEIQNIMGWERFVRRLNDRGYRVFITGSNSRMLGKEIATELRGRTLIYEIFPFSFVEFMEAKGTVYEKNMEYGDHRHIIQRLFEEYVSVGGYPEIAFTDHEQTRIRIIQDYFNTVFYRDLVERYQIKSTELLRQWLNTLMTNISSLISFTKVENDFKSRGIKVSKSTLSAFSAYIEDIFFGFFVEMYASSVRKRQINPRKFYLIDQGLHNFLTLKFSENKGRLLENIVFLELRRRGLPINYFKSAGGHEVDFLIRSDNCQHLIQVCHDLTHIHTYHREKNALFAGMKELGIKKGLILTWDEKRDEETDIGLIQIRPVWEWLLRLDDQEAFG